MADPRARNPMTSRAQKAEDGAAEYATKKATVAVTVTRLALPDRREYVMAYQLRAAFLAGWAAAKRSGKKGKGK